MEKLKANCSVFVLYLTCCLQRSNSLLDSANTMVQALLAINATLQNTAADMRNSVNNLTESLERMNTSLQQTAAQARRNEIIFFAQLMNDISLGPLQTIEFDNVLTNVGNAYDPRHGHFTAPVDGYYHFSASILSLLNGSVYVDMVKNGNAIARMFAAHKDYQSSSANANIGLTSSDMVWMRYAYSSAGSSLPHVGGGKFSFFSGFLIGDL